MKCGRIKRIVPDGLVLFLNGHEQLILNLSAARTCIGQRSLCMLIGTALLLLACRPECWLLEGRKVFIKAEGWQFLISFLLLSIALQMRPLRFCTSRLLHLPLLLLLITRMVMRVQDRLHELLALRIWGAIPFSAMCW